MLNVAVAAKNAQPLATHRELIQQCCNSWHVSLTLKARTTPLARQMDLLQGCVERDHLSSDLEQLVDLVGVVRQDEGQRQGGLAKERPNVVRCWRSFSAVVSRVMMYAVVFEVKQREVRVAAVRWGHGVMCKMMAN